MMFLVALAAQAVLAQPEPYVARPASQALALAYDAQHGGVAEDRAIETWLRRHPDAPRAERAMLAHRLCLAYGVTVGGERRAAACRLSTSFTADTEEKNDFAMAKALRREPPIAARGAATVPLVRGDTGVLSVVVSTHGQTSSWIVDSGAEITTIPESTARTLGVRMLQAQVNVGTSTAVRVDGGIGVIDTLVIGSARVTNVPVLVLPDAMLRIKDNKLIPGILGLPVLAAFHRVAWLHRGAMLCLGSRACAATSGPVRPVSIYWHENGIGVPIVLPRGTGGAHLDTGANLTELSPAGVTLLGPDRIATITSQTMQVGGAGGIDQASVRLMPALDYQMAGTRLRAHNVMVSARLDGAGRIGSDAIDQLDLLALDFDRMRAVAVPAAQQER
jgi:predicted aspartyl protease